MYMLIDIAENDVDDGGLSIVHKKWMTPLKTRVYWPPCAGKLAFNKALFAGENVNSDWNVYNIKKVLYETDSYEKAQQKLSEAKTNSDVQTDNETGPSRRKRQKPRRFSEDSSDTETNNQANNKIPRPPAPKTVSIRVEENESGAAQKQNTPTRKQSFFNIEISERGYEKLLTLITTITEQNNQILSQLSDLSDNISLGKSSGISVSSSVSAIITPSSLPVTLPLETEEDLKTFEKFLSEDNNRPSVVTFLSVIGGKDATITTYNILRKLLSDRLASEYSFYGKRLKKPFAVSLLKDVVLDAVKHNHKVTDTEIEDNIKTWLKHAPQRLKLSSKKNSSNLE